MTITEVSKEYDIPADTLRYYEKVGLLPTINRGSNGHRDYNENDCEWVKFIKCMRTAGVAVNALVEYVTLWKEGDSTVIRRKDILLEQRTKIVQDIEKLEDSLEKLDYKLAIYETKLKTIQEKLEK